MNCSWLLGSSCRVSNYPWYFFLSEFLIAFFSISVTYSSVLCCSPTYWKNYWKLVTFCWISIILFCSYSSYRFDNLQRFSSYSSSNDYLLFRFSQTSLMNRWLKQKMWKEVFWDLNTALALSLSTSSSRLSSSNSGTDFRIHRTCLSSCSPK